MTSIVEKPATIRHPDRDEAEDVMRLMLLQAEENSMFDIAPDLLGVAMERAFNFDRTILGVIGSKGDLRGGLMVYVGQPWYSHRPALQELFNFVHPAHRKSNYANDLIDYGKHLSDSMQMPLQIGVISNVRTEAKVRLYRRRLHYVGAFFTYNAHLGLEGAKAPAEQNNAIVSDPPEHEAA